jgi:tetratricopeptide (TPR) repeat protein
VHSTKLIDRLRETPVALLGLAALALFVIWAGSEAGYPVTHWAPGGLILIALLGVALLAVPLRLSDVPIAVRVSVLCLALFTALSYLSILWAQVPADAWEGANRTLFYLLVFALFALWPQRGKVAALMLGAWVVAMIGLAVFVLLHINGSATPAALFSEGRLRYPAAYENACAAVWCIALWPALLLSSSSRVNWPLRGLLTGGAVVLADLALLSQSRGSLFATVVMLVLVFALLPTRVRSLLVIAPVAIGVGASAPFVLRVGHRLLHGGDVHAAVHGAIAAIFIAAVAVGLLVALGCAIEQRSAISDAAAARLRRAIGTVAIVALIAGIAGAWIAVGDPVARAKHAWHTFKGGYGADNAHVDRLVSGLGSGRYDFYRVALDEFLAHPIVGIGADNFAEQYLARGHDEQTPHYPHSVELRTLSQTGIIGTILAVVGLVAALIAAGRAALSSFARRTDPLGAIVAAAALAGFAYWAVHGSFDWLWEFAGLGGPAFALLGTACALAPRGRAAPVEQPPGGQSGAAISGASADGARDARSRLRARRGALALGSLVALAAAASLIAPWSSQLRIERAASIWSTAPRAAYRQLEDAARLNPLSDEPYSLAGTIALRFGDLARADHEFSLALKRNRDDAYPTLERGAIASAEGRQAQARALLERTVRLTPQDKLARDALKVVRGGRRLDIESINRVILFKAQQIA